MTKESSEQLMLKKKKEKELNEAFLRQRPDPEGRPASVQQLPPQTSSVPSNPDKGKYEDAIPPPKSSP